MKNDFLSDLCWYCTQDAPYPTDPEFEKTMAEFLTLEEECRRVMGGGFTDRYEAARIDAYEWQEEDVFLRGLRFGVNLMLDVRPYHSNSTSAP